MPNCRHCGGLNAADSVQCEKCGALLATSPATEDVATPVHLSQHDAELVALLRGGRKIDAIKLHREVSSSGLKEAKDYVEALAAEQGIPQAKGCGAAALVLVTLSLGSAWAVVTLWRG
jgi:ribosomal protein L7/L12